MTSTVDEACGSLDGLPYEHFLLSVTRLSEILLQEYGEQIPQKWRDLCVQTLTEARAVDVSSVAHPTAVAALVPVWDAFMTSDDGAGIADEAVFGMLMHFGTMAHEFSELDPGPRFASDYVLSGFVEQRNPEAGRRGCARFVAVARCAADAAAAGMRADELREALSLL